MKRVNPEHACAALSDAVGGTWSLLAVRDNIVLQSDTLVAKMPRHPDGIDRLRNGVTSATFARRATSCVLQPAQPELVSTEAGPASLWPRITHESATGSTLSGTAAANLGRALAELSRVPHEDAAWDPYSRVPGRLSRTTFPTADVEHVRAVAQVAAGLVPSYSVSAFAHGDASVGNALVTLDGGVLLIDLDSAGSRPAGWDLACMYAHLALEGGRHDLFDAVLRGWVDRAPEPSGWREWALVKAAMATSFLLTMEPTERNRDILGRRCSAMLNWVDSGVAPVGLAALPM